MVSASPELFFRWDGRRIESRPMKGTMARGRWEQEDSRFRQRLLSSGKDRAENVMIVDLLRNDLGRVARFGSVQVERLFEVEWLETVWQMTSTVAAETRPGGGPVRHLQSHVPLRVEADRGPSSRSPSGSACWCQRTHPSRTPRPLLRARGASGVAFVSRYRRQTVDPVVDVLFPPAHPLVCSPPRRIGGGNDPSRSRRQIVVLLNPVISNTSGSLTTRPPTRDGIDRRRLTPNFLS